MPTCKSNDFLHQAERALENEQLQTALNRAKSGFVNKRLNAIQLVDDFEFLKSKAQQSKNYALTNLGHLLEQFEQKVVSCGGHIHWAETPDQLNNIVLSICQENNAQRITKGKSMISEETGLNVFLEENGLRLIETDLGEYIIQLAKEPPSHIIAPAVHKTRQQVAQLFEQNHKLGNRDLSEITSLVEEARQVLRKEFISADVGITGANVLVAETGSVVLVTNEGNGDLSASWPKTHIVTASIEKVVATIEDASNILDVLGRSATGQSMSTYTTFFTGPKRHEDLDGPENFHIILLDNGRSKLMNSPFQDMLRCIKCGACLNHCPVYSNTGGHAYGWVYPGPMGSVLTPLLNGLDQAKPLPNASTFCGRCEEVCPMGIPLPSLLRKLRQEQHENKLEPLLWSIGLGAYTLLSHYPRLYHSSVALGQKLLILTKRLFPKKSLPAAQDTQTFMQQWKAKQRKAP